MAQPNRPLGDIPYIDPSRIVVTDTPDTYESRFEALRQTDFRLAALIEDITRRVGYLEHQPAPVPPNGLMARFTSRKFLLAAIPAAAAIVSAFGAAFGFLHPMVPVICTAVAAFLGSVFVIVEGVADWKERVARVQANERLKVAAMQRYPVGTITAADINRDTLRSSKLGP